MTHEEAHELFGLHALRALEPADAAALAAHLAHCAACRDQAADLERTAAELARVPPPLAPSAEITRRILGAMEDVGATPRDRRIASSGPRAQRWWRPLRLVAGLGIAAMIAGLVVSQWTLRTRLDRALATIASGGELLRFIASPDVRTVALASDSLPDARAFVAYDRGSGRLVVVAFGVPPPPSGQVYQVWAITDGIRPAAVFAPDASGGALVRDGRALSHGDEPLFTITLESAPGAPEPTGRMLFLGGERPGGG